MTEKRTEEIRIDLDDIIYFLNSSKKPDFSATIIKRSNTIYELIIKNKKNDKSLPIQSKKITIKNTANQENKEKEIFYFPVLKYTSYFKGILKFPKTEYIFLFLHIINDTTIAVFSNNILEYINKASKEEVSGNKSNAISDLDLNEFEKLTSSFYLLCKNEESSYQWKNILSFFPTFLDISLKGNDYKNLIYKIKGDSIALFKSRYMQEKTIKTLILGKQGKHLIHAMFYGNLLKNLTFKIENASIDLNGKGKGGFHITTTKNNDIYFNKIDKIVSKINNGEEGRKSELPIFFLDRNIGKDTAEELENYIFIDMFPRVFKEDKGQIFVLGFKDISKKDNKKEISKKKGGLCLKEFLSISDGCEYNFKALKSTIQSNYQYEFLSDIDNNAEDKNVPKMNKLINDTDLFILFSSKDSKELFLGKIKTPSKRKEGIVTHHREEDIVTHYIESYKLYASFGDFKLEEKISIDKEEDGENINFTYTNIAHTNKKENIEDTFSFVLEGKTLYFKIKNKDREHNEGLEYFFNGASLSGEDKISLGLISQLNNGKIKIGNKKAIHGELADIIGIGEKDNRIIVHLLHMKKGPFVTNGKEDGYSYYTTAIGQMLQKIEPILTNSSEKFFTNSQSKEIKDKIHEFIKETNKSWAAKTIEFDVEKNFLNKLHKAQAIELRIGIAILASQLDSNLNKKTFFMVDAILLKGFEHTIKPFLGKEINITFYPIVINNKNNKNS